MTTYQRRTFLKTTLLAAAASMTASARGALRAWHQEPSLPRGLSHPFFAQAKHPDVIAHRGGNGQWPGETMYAMTQANAMGCDVLEMDVYLTKDHELVLMHDLDVSKTTAGSGEVYKYTVEQITALRADRHWSAQCKPSLRPQEVSQHEQELHVPTLEQVLKAFPDTRMVIEMKKAPEEFSPVDRLCELLTPPNMTEKVLVASFHGPFMDAFRSRLPHIATSFSPDLGDVLKLTPKKLENLINMLLNRPANQPGPDALQLPHVILTPHIVQKVKARGLALHAWTVNTPKAMERMKTLGVDGIITDCPSTLFEHLGRVAHTPQS